MANVLVLGGGFGGVVAAEGLAKRLGPEHRITLVSRHREFTFFPSLVRLAFDRCQSDTPGKAGGLMSGAASKAVTLSN